MTARKLDPDTQAELMLAVRELIARIERLERSLTLARRRLGALLKITGQDQ